MINSRLVVHLGMHKTGSTAVQVNFSKQPNFQSWQYPIEGRPISNFKQGHHLIPWSYVSDLSKNILPENIKEEIQSFSFLQTFSPYFFNASNIFISSEEFSGLSLPELKNFYKDANELSGNNVFSILFLRDLREWYESAYITSVIHSGYTNTFSHFITSNRIDQFFESIPFIAHSSNLIITKYSGGINSISSIKYILNKIKESDIHTNPWILSFDKDQASGSNPVYNRSFSSNSALFIRNAMLRGASREVAIELEAKRSDHERQKIRPLYTDVDKELILDKQKKIDTIISSL